MPPLFVRRYSPYTVALHRRPKYMTQPLIQRLDHDLLAVDSSRHQKLSVVSRQLRLLLAFHTGPGNGSDTPAPELDEGSGLLLAPAQTADGMPQSTQIAAFLGVDVASGVDVGTLVSNLASLYVSICGVLGYLSLQHGGDRVVDSSWMYLHNHLWAWLLCMGADKPLVKQWLGHLFPWRDNINADVDEAWVKDTDHRQSSFVPFQSFIEVGERADALATGLFENNPDDSSLTLQLFDSLLPSKLGNEASMRHVGPRPVVTSLDLLRHRNVEGYPSSSVATQAYEQLTISHPKYLGRYVGCKLFALRYKVVQSTRTSRSGEVKHKRKVGALSLDVSAEAQMLMCVCVCGQISMDYPAIMPDIVPFVTLLQLLNHADNEGRHVARMQSVIEALITGFVDAAEDCASDEALQEFMVPLASDEGTSESKAAAPGATSDVVPGDSAAADTAVGTVVATVVEGEAADAVATVDAADSSQGEQQAEAEGDVAASPDAAASTDAGAGDAGAASAGAAASDAGAGAASAGAGAGAGAGGLATSESAASDTMRSLKARKLRFMGAALHRCLSTCIGICPGVFRRRVLLRVSCIRVCILGASHVVVGYPANSTHTVHELIVDAFWRASVAMCKTSLGELKFWESHKFPHIVAVPDKPLTAEFVELVGPRTLLWWLCLA